MFDHALYDRMIAAGESPAIADICASRKCPSNRGTDRAFLQGKMHNNGFADRDPLNEETITEARAAGIDTAGKVYCGPLADHRGHLDPQAWVSGVDDVKRVARERNLNVTGAVNHKAVDLPPTPDVPLAPDIIEEMIEMQAMKDPAILQRDPRELTEELVEKHSPKWSTVS
jgi:hypothetical protein